MDGWSGITVVSSLSSVPAESAQPPSLPPSDAEPQLIRTSDLAAVVLSFVRLFDHSFLGRSVTRLVIASFIERRRCSLEKPGDFSVALEQIGFPLFFPKRRFTEGEGRLQFHSWSHHYF